MPVSMYGETFSHTSPLGVLTVPETTPCIQWSPMPQSVLIDLSPWEDQWVLIPLGELMVPEGTKSTQMHQYEKFLPI